MPKATKSAITNCESAHTALIRSLAALTPPKIIGQVDANDIEARADHLHAIHTAVIRYLEVIIASTVENLAAAGRIDQGRAALVLLDTVSGCDFDVIAALVGAGCNFELPVAA